MKLLYTCFFTLVLFLPLLFSSFFFVHTSFQEFFSPEIFFCSFTSFEKKRRKKKRKRKQWRKKKRGPMSPLFDAGFLTPPSDFVSLLLHPDFLFVAIEVAQWVVFGEEEQKSETSDKKPAQAGQMDGGDLLGSGTPSSPPTTPTLLPSSSALPPLSVLPPPIAALVLYTALCDEHSLRILGHPSSTRSRDSLADSMQEARGSERKGEPLPSMHHCDASFLYPPCLILSEEERQATLCLSLSATISSDASSFLLSKKGDLSIAEGQRRIAALQLSSTQKLCRKILQHFPEFFSILADHVPCSPAPDIPWKVDVNGEKEGCASTLGASAVGKEYLFKRDEAGKGWWEWDRPGGTTGQVDHRDGALQKECGTTPLYSLKEIFVGSREAKKNALPNMTNPIRTAGHSVPFLPKPVKSLLQAGGGVPSILSHYDYIHQTFPDYEDALRRHERELEKSLILSLQKQLSSE